VIGQDGDNSPPSESIFAQHGAGEQHAVFLGVGAGAQGSHAVALVAVEGPVDFQRLAEQAFAALGGRDLVEDGLGFEHAVEVANAGVVAADDHLGAAVVLAEGGVQQALAGTGIAHIQRVAALDDVVSRRSSF
jgi:hypothetical protein